MQYEILKNVPNNMKIQDEITDKLWEEFMFNDPVSNKYWGELYNLFPEYQFSLKVKDKIIGVANCLPYFWDRPFEQLPEKGWDWVFEKGVNDRLNNVKANTLNGLQIAVNLEFQGQGISSLILKEMIILARDNGYKYVTIPVRPSMKSIYPLITIDNYINWKRSDGLPFDPWLRVHRKMGGQIIKPCHQAMYIPGTIEQWEQWTGMKFLETGEYVVKGALNPIKIDIEQDLGEYIEPNIWVLHRV
ncbi:MAG: GNAT family N-acetyltransferase [Candidatus Cloacimonetes bacterium]|jgi:GNAT superfamily N-acetyltransferase|nr:GNAT family N-acetyltransferase [Candidatus Cloacimonadota bacterium]